jgi:hypothetical protein
MVQAAMAYPKKHQFHDNQTLAQNHHSLVKFSADIKEKKRQSPAEARSAASTPPHRQRRTSSPETNLSDSHMPVTALSVEHSNSPPQPKQRKKRKEWN